jgi:hypothetical protein
MEKAGTTEYNLCHVREKSCYRANMKAWREIKGGRGFAKLIGEISRKRQEFAQSYAFNSSLSGG